MTNLGVVWGENNPQRWCRIIGILIHLQFGLTFHTDLLWRIAMEFEFIYLMFIAFLKASTSAYMAFDKSEHERVTIEIII